MRVIRGINNLQQKFKNPVVTVGVFDGVHLAHQRVIKEVVRQAKILAGSSIVVTFNPHPAKTLKKYSAISLITTVEHRLALIGALGVDVCLFLDFNKDFSQMSAEDFTRQILVDAIGAKYLIVGEGFRFGRGRTGTLSFLEKLSKRHGFKVRKIDSIKMNSCTISSSKIRSLIQKGKVSQVNSLLGRKFSIFGEVKPGVARGRILGYPTANIAPAEEIIPASGVYAVFVKLNNKIFSGILNIGSRPTFQRTKIPSCTIEVHIFNFDNNIYGKTLEVFFIRRIRAERKFNSHSELLRQIKQDERKARRILLLARTPSLKHTLI